MNTRAGADFFSGSPLIIKKITISLSNMRHKRRLGTKSNSDIIFEIFVIIFGELIRVRNLNEVEARIEPGSNP